MPAPKKRYRFERQGQLYRDGRLMRVKIEDFEQWLEESKAAI